MLDADGLGVLSVATCSREVTDGEDEDDVVLHDVLEVALVSGGRGANGGYEEYLKISV